MLRPPKDTSNQPAQPSVESGNRPQPRPLSHGEPFSGHASNNFIYPPRFFNSQSHATALIGRRNQLLCTSGIVSKLVAYHIVVYGSELRTKKGRAIHWETELEDRGLARPPLLTWRSPTARR